MRIALISLGRRGSGGLIGYELCSGLSRLATVKAFISSFSENLVAWQKSDLQYYAVPSYRNSAEALWSWVYQTGIRRLAAEINEWQPDVLLFPMFYTWNPFLQHRLNQFPSIVLVHDPLPHPGATNLFFKRLENTSIRKAARCIVLSRRFKSELINQGVHPDRIDFVPHGELSYFQRSGNRDLGMLTSSGPYQPNLLFFGRITTYKGLEILLKAFAKLSKDFAVKLTIAGAGNLRPYRRLLEGLENVRVINRWLDEKEIDLLFRQATILVLPYTSASQSGAIPIAATYALPVIASRVGGIPEQIEDGTTGLLVEPGSVDSLVNAIQLFLSDLPAARKTGKNLRREYQENRNWVTISNMVYCSCEKAISGSHA